MTGQQPALIISAGCFFGKGRFGMKEQTLQPSESFLVAALLALLLTVLAARLEPPIPRKKQLAYLAVLTAGTWLALLPWALTDPVFHPVNYAITPVFQLLWAGLLLVFSLLAGKCRHSLNA